MARMATRRLQFQFVAASPWILAAAPLATPSSYFLTVFSTLANNDIPTLQSPLEVFGATKFNLSSSEIARMLNKVPSLKTLKTLENVERIVRILNEHGCTQHQIAQIMMKQPALLKMSAEKIVEPKIQLLKECGIQGQILAEVLNRVPRFLGTNLERGLIPNIALLKNIFKSQNSLVKAICKAPSILIFNQEKVLKPSLAFWEGCGLSGDELSKFLLGNPILMAFSSPTPAHFDLIRKIGIPQGNKMYKFIMRIIVTSRIETLEAKIQNLQRCGLSAEETLALLRVYPSTLCLSEENVREKMEFLVNQMELPANTVVKDSRVLGMSLEKIIKPRFLVVQKIKSMKGAENLKLKSLRTILTMPESRFLQSVIKENPESSTLYSVYQNAVADASASKKTANKGFLFLRG